MCQIAMLPGNCKQPTVSLMKHVILVVEKLSIHIFIKGTQNNVLFMLH